MFQEHGLWLSAKKLDLVVDHDFGDASDVEFLGKIGELRALDGIGSDVCILHRHLMSQPRRGWTVRSGGCDEDPNMDRLGHSTEGAPSCFGEPRGSF